MQHNESKPAQNSQKKKNNNKQQQKPKPKKKCELVAVGRSAAGWSGPGWCCGLWGSACVYGCAAPRHTTWTINTDWGEFLTELAV